jgi:hypothetical protein
VAAALGEPAAGAPVPEPAALRARAPEVWGPHAEAAYDDLARRRVLVRGREGGWRWGPRAHEIHHWRARYAWPDEGARPAAFAAGPRRAAPAGSAVPGAGPA